MCSPMAVVAGGSAIASGLANNSQAKKNAATTQATLDRDTETSKELFNDRNERLIEANDDQFSLSSREYDSRTGARRSTESDIAQIFSDAVQGVGARQSGVRRDRAIAAGSYNDLLAGERQNQERLMREGDASVDSTVRDFNFDNRTAVRENAAADRTASISANLAPQLKNTAVGDAPLLVRRMLEKAEADGVSRALQTANAGARLDSYGDMVRIGDEKLDAGADTLNRVFNDAEQGLRNLEAQTEPFARAFERAEKLGRADIADITAQAERGAGIRAEHGNRVLEESGDYETARSGIIDNYVNSLNGSSLAYQDALRRNQQIKLSNMQSTSAIGQLFSGISSVAGAAGGGPSWGKVGSFLGGSNFPAGTVMNYGGR